MPSTARGFHLLNDAQNAARLPLHVLSIHKTYRPKSFAIYHVPRYAWMGFSPRSLPTKWHIIGSHPRIRQTRVEMRNHTYAKGLSSPVTLTLLF